MTDVEDRFDNYLGVMIAGQHETINGTFTESDLKTIVNVIDEAYHVPKLLEHIVEEMCDKYCKWPEKWNTEEYGDLCESSICANCPLNRLT